MEQSRTHETVGEADPPHAGPYDESGIQTLLELGQALDRLPAHTPGHDSDLSLLAQHRRGEQLVLGGTRQPREALGDDPDDACRYPQGCVRPPGPAELGEVERVASGQAEGLIDDLAWQL